MELPEINCDMGEGMDNDALLMPFIHAANIACGGHAGDVDSMRATVALCIRYRVAIGAHPSFPDRANFGRAEMIMEPEELAISIKEQITALQKIAKDAGAAVVHVKPHGALYNMAAKNRRMANLIAETIRETDEDLVLVGLSDSHLISEAKALGLKTKSEVFADRTYRNDGSLTPRSQPHSMIDDAEKAVAQVLEMITKSVVTTVNGKQVPIVAETVCIHGDSENAIAIARALHEAFKQPK